jgi:oligosaccharide repeat unit polymerase
MKNPLDNKIRIKPIPFLAIFLLVFLVINLLGIINFPFYTNNLKTGQLVWLVVIGFFGFLLGTLIVRFLGFKFFRSKGAYKPGVLKVIFWISYLTSLFLVAITHVRSGGIILFLSTDRFAGSTVVTMFVYIGIVTTLLYFAHLLISNTKIKLYHVLLIGLQALSGLSMGYRGPLVMLVASCFIIYFTIRNDHGNKHKNIFSPRNIILFLGGILLMSAVASFRVSQEYSVESFFKNIDMNYMEENYLLKPYLSTLSVFRYDQEVVTILIRKTEYNHLNGELAIANLRTLLPGMQLGARNMIGGIIDARKFPDGRPWSITPTLQGALFVDAGRFGVFFGFFILAALIEYLKKLMLVRRNPFSVVIYVLLAVNSLMLIHSGYFDALVYILFFILFAVNFLLTRIKYTI